MHWYTPQWPIPSQRPQGNGTNFNCEVCICGKMVHALFQSSHEVAHVHLGCVHSNVCGPMEVTSLGKNCYFCTLINDKTHLIWFHPCKSKLGFTPWFICMDKLFANQYGTHVKILQSDGGGEYVHTVLHEYCGENGICIELTIPHTPEQNSVTKRMNWKILNKGHMIMRMPEPLTSFGPKPSQLQSTQSIEPSVQTQVV